MPHSAQIGLEDSIANTLGMLYERKARGATLIRVLEDYRRCKMTQKLPQRTARALTDDRTAHEQELERLRMRRAAVEQVIRSIEAYSSAPPSSSAHR